MAFNYLPNEIKEKIFLYAIDYTPALKMVSKLWREIISYRGFNRRISFKDLVRRGDVDLLIDLHKRQKKDHNCSILIYAAFYGREELCHLAKRWGESNFEGMLYAVTKGGHKNICRIARIWGAEGIQDFTSVFSVKAGCKHFFHHTAFRPPLPLSRFREDSNLERMCYGGKDKDLQSIVKEWELNDAILIFSVQNYLKTRNTHITITKRVDEKGRRKRMLNSKPKDVWSDGSTIIVIY